MILSLNTVTKKFTQGNTAISVVSNISYTFCQGQSYAIIGKSGSGKSTLLQILAGIEQPTTGSVIVNGTKLDQLNKSQYAGFLHTGIGILFQDPCLIQELTVLENVMLKGLIAGVNYEKIAQKARELLTQIGLANKANACPATLSGGQQQRVALARALCTRPQFLLADEPTGNLDQHIGHEIIELMLHYQNTYSMGLILCTHDQALARRCTTTLELSNGSLIPINQDDYSAGYHERINAPRKEVYP